MLVAVLLAALAAGCGGDGSSGAGRTITVTGAGVVKAVPDEAEAGFGASATAATAPAARAASDRLLRRVIAALKARGIAAADIQTEQISLYPSFGPKGNKVVGYVASNSVTVHIRDLDDLGAIISAAVAAGANQTSGPSLASSEQQELYRRALKAAVADARSRAEAIASASDATLGEIRTVSESSSGAPIPLEAKAAADRSAAAPIEPGKVKVEAQVTVTFALE
jgi:uncharacterized protein YggE